MRSGDGEGGRIKDDRHGFRARREALGLSQRRLAEIAGTNHSRIQTLETSTPTGRDSSSTAYAAVEKALTECEERQKHGLAADPGVSVQRKPPVSAPARVHLSIKGRTPVYAIDNERQGLFTLTEVVIGYIRTPEHMEASPGVFAVLVRGAQMHPMYRPGDTLVVNPFGVPQPGSGVVLTSSASSAIKIREFVQETNEDWTLQRYGPNPEIEAVSKDEFDRVGVVQTVIPGR